MHLPHHHRHEARLAFGDPAVFVFIEPLAEARRFTQFTGGIAHPHIMTNNIVADANLAARYIAFDVSGRQERSPREGTGVWIRAW